MKPTFEHYSSDMVTVIEVDGTIRYQSPALERVLGYRPEEHVGRNVYEFLHPGDLARGGSALSAVLESPGVGPAFEFRWRHKDGGWRWLESIGNNLLHDPEVRAIVSSSRDVTARKGEEVEARYRALVENLPTGILVEGEDGRVIDANPRFCEMFGVEAPPESLTGRGLSPARDEGLLSGDQQSFAARVEEILRLGEPVIGDELAMAGGRFLERDYTPVYANGRRTWHMWVYRDVTGRRRAERALADERGLLRTIVESAHDAIFVKDREHRFLLNNRRHLEALGLASQEAALGKTNADLWGDEAAPFLEDDRRVMELGETLADREERIRTASGERRWFSTTKVPLLGVGGEIEGLVGISRDVSHRRRAEEALRQSEARYRAVVEQSVEGIFLFEPDTGRILESNAALREMLGYSSEELLGMTVYEIVAHDRREVEASLREDLRHRRRLAGERSYRRKDGTLVEVEVGMTVVPYQGKEALCSVVRDLTERKRLERELRHQATHDPLTGLPNRTLFTERLVQALEREPEMGGRVAVLCLDLDGFKAVNDRRGHEAGDRLLVDIAGRLLQSLRPGDTACRLGGDEFLVLLEDSTPALAEAVARRLLEELAAPFGPEGEGDVTRLTASAGVALAEEGGERELAPEERAERLIRQADDAMYRAKQSGGGGVRSDRGR